MRLLHIVIEYSSPISDLLKVYTSYIRSLCEQSAVVWHSGLTQENEDDIERVQKTALKIIFGQKYVNYENALQLSNLTSLKERREKLCLNFAKSCLKNDMTKDLFPLNNIVYENIRKQKNTRSIMEIPRECSNHQ